MNAPDVEAAAAIINANWRIEYSGYVDAALLSKAGCRKRRKELATELLNGRIKNYIYEHRGLPEAVLSFGETADADRAGAFEIWRIYVSPRFQGKGAGSRLIFFAIDEARRTGYKEIVIWAFKQNERACRFYRRLGFFIDKEEYLGEPYNAEGVRFIRTITPMFETPSI